MSTERFVLVGGIAFGLSMLLNWRFCRPLSRFYILDHPNARSLHTRPTPRSGGIAIVSGILAAAIVAAMLCGYEEILGWIGSATLLVAMTSFLDDRFQLSAIQRVVVHFISAGLVVYGGLTLDMPLLPSGSGALSSVLVLPATVLYLVWMLNLYNFMDGMDGLAGGMAALGFGALAVLGATAGHDLYTALCLAICSAAGGFLVFNFPPARIFMGDTGSSVFGLLAGVFSIWGARENLFPFWVAVLVFSPFIVDATATLIRRMMARERFWEAHRTHYYQRLVRLGWGHRRTVLWEYALMISCAISALYAASATVGMQWTVAGFWIGVYLLLVFAVDRLENAKARQTFERSGTS